MIGTNGAGQVRTTLAVAWVRSSGAGSLHLCGRASRLSPHVLAGPALPIPEGGASPEPHGHRDMRMATFTGTPSDLQDKVFSQVPRRK